MATAGTLKQAADEQLFADAFEAALRQYVQLLELQPLNLDARLRVGDCLLGLGEVQRAAVVYTRLAQYAAHASYPLRALIPLKILTQLEPELSTLVSSIAELYASDSPRLGRSTRRSPPPASDPLPRHSAPPAESLAQLCTHAAQLAAEFRAEPGLLPEKLMPIPLLSTLDRPGLARVLQLLELIRVRPGASVVEQGSDDASLYVLARGSVRVSRREPDGKVRTLSDLQEGAVFGELSFLSGAPRAAGVTALSDCDLLKLPVSALATAGAVETQLRAQLHAFARERLLGHVMANSVLFAPLEFGQRLDLVKRFVELELPAGAEIVRQGQPSRGAYVVLRGEVAVERTEGERSVELARLGPGELFGEMSLLSGAGATSTVTAVVPSTLMLLDKPYFDRLMAAMPELREQLEQLAGRRSRAIAASFAPPEPDSDEGIFVEVLL